MRLILEDWRYHRSLKYGTYYLGLLYWYSNVTSIYSGLRWGEYMAHRNGKGNGGQANSPGRHWLCEHVAWRSFMGLLFRHPGMLSSLCNPFADRPTLDFIYGCLITNQLHSMMTSSNGNIFRVTGPLCGEFTGHRWIPDTKASDAELWCFSLICALNKRLSKQSWSWWFETPSRSLWRHCNGFELKIWHQDSNPSNVRHCYTPGSLTLWHYTIPSALVI